MCRVCGRMVKCIFDSMPSRLPTRTFSKITRVQPTQVISRQLSHAVPAASTSTSPGTQRPVAAPTFKLPLRAKLHQVSATQQATLTSGLEAESLPPSLLVNAQQTPVGATSTDDLMQRPVHSKPLVLSKSVQTLLPALSAQSPHYITTHIHRFPYLVQTGDTLRLPFHMKGVSSGDVLRFNRASVLGSRDFTLKAGTASTETYDRKRTGEPNYLDERLFEVRARVIGVDSGPMFRQEKTKRRNRRVKTVKSKHRYTILKIMQVRVKSLDELMQEKGTILLES